MVCLMMAFFAVGAMAQNSIVGTWKTIDDETGDVKSQVQIYKAKDGRYYGKIIKLYRKPNEEQNPKCTKCPKKDDRYNQPINGMIIVTRMKAASDLKSASSGKILDPKSGKTYGCNMTVQDGGKKLKVRGFLGIAALGRTQTWLRVQ